MLKQHIVAICGPKGAAEPLIRFFDHTPLNNASYIILRHLPGNYQSKLNDILKRHSRLIVVEARDGSSIENDFVYYAPPHFHLEIQDGTIHLVERKDGPNRAFDIFLDSLARNENRRKSIAIVLSGIGKDGLEGVAAIKKAGGLVIVQSPESCRDPELPLLLIKKELAHFILMPEDMPVVIHGFVNRFDYQNAKHYFSPGSESIDSIQEET